MTQFCELSPDQGQHGENVFNSRKIKYITFLQTLHVLGSESDTNSVHLGSLCRGLLRVLIESTLQNNSV